MNASVESSVKYLDAVDNEIPCATAETLSSEHAKEIIEPFRSMIERESDVLANDIRSSCGPTLPLSLEIAVNIARKEIEAGLYGLVHRATVLELEVQRIICEESGVPFVETDILRDPLFAEKLRREYLALAAPLSRRIVLWRTSVTKFYHRLSVDWLSICKSFGVVFDDKLIGVDIAGDRHRGGHAVRVLRFESGARLVYKPRSLRLDVGYNQILAWINDFNALPRLLCLRHLVRADYGWVEFVAPSSCESPTQIDDFYERLGAQLALLHVLCGGDMHEENLIACGEHPVLIDMESLFHPLQEDWIQGDLEVVLKQRTVLGIGLLPDRVFMDPMGTSGPVGGMADVENVLGPDMTARTVRDRNGRLRVERLPEVISSSDNVPRLCGKKVSAASYIQRVLQGFRRAYALIAEHRSYLLSSRGPIGRLKGARARCILRPTMSYGRLMYESFHPDFLRDQAAREMWLDHLFTGASEPRWRWVAEAERADLDDVDIPYFSCRNDSKDLEDSRGAKYEEFFSRTSFERVQARVSGLSEDDREVQEWVIRASLAAVAPPRSMVRRLPLPTKAADGRHRPSDEVLYEVASNIGDRILQLRIESDQGRGWLSLACRDNDYFVVERCDQSLFAGVTGLGVFFDRLAAHTGKRRYTEAAQVHLTEGLVDVASGEADGAFSGAVGAQYARLLSSTAQPATSVQRACFPRPGLVQGVDVLGGLAGCLLVSLTWLERGGPPELHGYIEEVAHELAQRAQKTVNGVAWPEPTSPTLVDDAAKSFGFGHGNGGIGVALLRAANLFASEDLLFLGLEAFRYERERFLDRPDGSDAAHWCYGAGGVALARVQALPHVEGAAAAEVTDDLERAVALLMKNGFGESHCLCHGDLGNLDILRQAAHALSREGWMEAADLVLADIITEIQTDGARCGNWLDLDSPGLMTGLAGIGYGLLREAGPALVPSIVSVRA